MARKKTYGQQIADLYKSLEDLPLKGLGSVKEHEEKCRINFEIWQVRERQANEGGDIKAAAACSREAREWSARIVHAQKASVSDRIDELRQMLDDQARFTQELASLN